MAYKAAAFSYHCLHPYPKQGSFKESKSVVDGRFVGLVIDNSCQSSHTDQRIDQWLEQIKPQLLAATA